MVCLHGFSALAELLVGALVSLLHLQTCPANVSFCSLVFLGNLCFIFLAPFLHNFIFVFPTNFHQHLQHHNSKHICFLLKSKVISASFGTEWMLKAITCYTAQHALVIDSRPDTPLTDIDSHNRSFAVRTLRANQYLSAMGVTMITIDDFLHWFL